MIPSPWVAVLLALGAFRLIRLAAWDSFPPVAAARAWILGEYVVSSGNANQRMRLTSEPPSLEYRYRRPLLAELVHCAFCLSLWLSVGVYAAWIWEPRWTLYAAYPLSLSAAVGLIAKNLDP